MSSTDNNRPDDTSGFSEKEHQIHAEALQSIHEEIRRGKPWRQIVSDLTIHDAELKTIILDDFLKITLAERHFQQQQSIKTVSKQLRIPVKLLTETKRDMVREVEESAIKAYEACRLSDGQPSLPLK